MRNTSSSSSDKKIVLLPTLYGRRLTSAAAFSGAAPTPSPADVCDAASCSSSVLTFFMVLSRDFSLRKGHLVIPYDLGNERNKGYGSDSVT
mmetsp:Transcript_6808/g.21292  ORF Transcript_6808/g.21292 Transcript_6808/m.21292 type:complete len:91 (-) Transcript_6808:480-752(-)